MFQRKKVVFLLNILKFIIYDYKFSLCWFQYVAFVVQQKSYPQKPSGSSFPPISYRLSGRGNRWFWLVSISKFKRQAESKLSKTWLPIIHMSGVNNSFNIFN